MDLNETFITESPNITSIIAAFEANENPISLFLNQQFITCEYLEEKIDSIDDNLDAVKEWITTYRNVDVNKTKFNQCMIKFKAIEKKIRNLYKQIVNECEKKTKKEPFNNVKCGFCDTKFTFTTPADLIEMEDHADIASILTLGNSLQVPLDDNEETKIQYKDNEEIELLVNYSPEILTKLYPKHIMQNVCKYENQNKYFTIQSVSTFAPCFQCLLCNIDISSYKCIDSHIYGQQHTKKLKIPRVFNRVIEYHEQFTALPPKFQILQVVYKPASYYSAQRFFHCAVCFKSIKTKDIVKHAAEDTIHLLKFQSRKFTNYHFFEELNKIMISETSDDDDDDDDSLKSVVSEDDPAQSTSVPTTNGSNETGNSNNNNSPTKKNNKFPVVLKHTIVPSYKDDPIEMNDFIPNRFQNHLKFIDYDFDDATNASCVCMFCKKTINKNHQELMAHFITEDHKRKSLTEFAKIKYSYYCGICYKYIKTELNWMNHSHSSDHILREEIIRNKILKDPNIKEYECINCALIIYGNKGCIDAHKNGKFGVPSRRKKIKEIKLPNQLELILKDENIFTSEIYKVSKDSVDVLNSIDLALKCCTAIEQALTPVFDGQVKAYPFGSRVSGLGSMASDLDVFVDVGSMYDGLCNQSNEKQKYFVQQASRALRRHRDFDDICAIPAARTPIVQVYHNVTDLDCDLSFRHGLSVENTEFLRLCIDIQPKLKTLILFLKKWIILNNLKDKISTYAISMMAIYFMQNRKYLPSLQDLRKIDPRPSKMIAGWETFCFRKPISELRELYPLYSLFTRDLLSEFFQFYITFNFQTQVICPLLGHSISKSDFSDPKGSLLPNEMINYVNKINENKENEIFKLTKSICIQDPFDLSHNLTKACTVDVLTKILTLSKQSYLLLCNQR